MQLVSHKLGRLLVPYCLAALLLANLWLPYGLYRVFSLCQVLFYCLACVGGLISTYRGGNRAARAALGISGIRSQPGHTGGMHKALQDSHPLLPRDRPAALSGRPASAVFREVAHFVSSFAV